MANISPAGEGTPVSHSQFDANEKVSEEVDLTLPELGGSPVSQSQVAENIEKVSKNALPDHLRSAIERNTDGKLNPLKQAVNVKNLSAEHLDTVALSLIYRMRGE